MALPAVVVVACWTKATLEALPAVMVNPFVVPLTCVPLIVAEAVSVGEPALLSA